MADSITRETFEQAPTDTKLLLMWDEIHGLCEQVRGCRGEMETRVKKLEGRKRIDTATSGAAGIIGGALVMMGKLILGGRD